MIVVGPFTTIQDRGNACGSN